MYYFTFDYYVISSRILYMFNDGNNKFLNRELSPRGLLLPEAAIRAWIVASLWDLAGASVALLPRCLSGLGEIGRFVVLFSRFRGPVGSCDGCPVGYWGGAREPFSIGMVAPVAAIGQRAPYEIYEPQVPRRRAGSRDKP